MFRKIVLAVVLAVLFLVSAISFTPPDVILIEKDTYDVGEVVVIRFQVPDGDHNIRIVADKTYNYPNFAKQIRFIPKGEGNHRIELYSGYELVSTKSFSVGARHDSIGPVAAPSVPISVKPSYNLGEMVNIALDVQDTAGLSLEVSSGKTFRYDVVDREIQFLPKTAGRYEIRLLSGGGVIAAGSFEVLGGLEAKEVKFRSGKRFARTMVAQAPGEYSATAVGKELWRCAQWDFEDQQCQGSWEKLKDITPGKPYTFSSSEGPAFAEAGIATVNTDKPIYHPGETVKMWMVVLDQSGYLADADVELDILTPDGRLDSLVVQREELGIYYSIFNDTDLQGRYLLTVAASGLGVEYNLSNYFDVQEHYPFDIIRSSPITTDPWQGPFESSILVSSYNNTDAVDIIERLPATFEIVEASGVMTADSEYKYIRWIGVPNGSTVSYRALPPLETPNLYELGPASVRFGTEEFFESRPWYLAVDPVARSAFYDPVSTVSSNWNAGTGITYAEIDDGTRYPNLPNIGDYVADTASDNVISEFGFNPVSQKNISSITLWVYASTGANAQFTYYLQQSGTNRCSKFVGVNNASGWRGCIWSSPTGDLSTLTIELGGVTKSGGGANTNAYVYAAYLRVNYTDNNPRILSLNSPAAFANISIKPIDFNFTPSDDYGFQNCSLFTNLSGWSAKSTILSITNGTNNRISYSPSDGRFAWNIRCIDTAGQAGWFASNRTATVDTQPPVVKALTASPQNQLINLQVDIFANVTDVIRVDKVRAQITLPNSTVLTYLMTDPDGDKRYNLSFKYTPIVGRYNITIIANDSFGLVNNSVKGYFNISYGILSIKTDKPTYVLGDTVSIWGYGFTPYKNVTFKLINPTGDPAQAPVTLKANLTGGVNTSWYVDPGSFLGTYSMNFTDELLRSVNSTFDVVSAIVFADKSSYYQGQVVLIEGSTWDPDEIVTLNVTYMGATVYGLLNVTSNSTGHINASWQIPFDQYVGSHVLSAFQPLNPNKHDTDVFDVMARPTTVSTEYPWYKAGERANISGTYFRPGATVRINVYNSTGQNISGYPKFILANASGHINDSFVVSVPVGDYTINATDLVYPNIQDTAAILVVVPMVSTDSQTYNGGDTVRLTGLYWDRGKNVTLNIINYTGQSEYGYPRNLTANSTGGFVHTLTARAIGTSAALYNVTASNAFDISENATANFTVLRQASLTTDKTYYLQRELVNISGNYYSGNEDVTLWVKSKDNGGIALGYPLPVAADSQGHFNHYFNVSDYCPGNYTVLGTDTLQPDVLNDSADFVVRVWWNNSWQRRRSIKVTSASSYSGIPVIVNITGLGGYLSSCDSELRVVSSTTGQPVQFNIWGGDDSTWCEIEFLATIGPGANQSIYYVYYNNSQATAPGYGDIGSKNFIFYDAFDDVGLDGWSQDAQNDWERDVERSLNLGGGSVLVDGAATAAWVSPTTSFDLDPAVYRHANLTFAWLLEPGFDTGESISLQYYDGGAWNTIDTIAGSGGGNTQGGEEGTWVQEQFTLPLSYLISNFNFRYISTVSGADEDGFVDIVNLSARYYGTPGVNATTGPTEVYLTSCDRIDAQAPSITITTPPNYFNTTDSTPQINFTMTDDVDQVINYTVFVDGVANGQVGSGNNATPVLLDLNTLSQGLHQIKVEARDDYNNRKNSSTKYIRVDYTGPVTTITTLMNFTNRSTSPVTVSVTSADAYLPVSAVVMQYRENQMQTWTTICTDTTSPYSCPWVISSLPDNSSYQVRAYANDSLNNKGNNYTVTNITLDRTGPTTTLTAPVNFTNISTTSYTVTATSTDLLNPINTVTFQYRTGPSASWQQICKDTNFPFSCSWNTAALQDGKSYQVRAFANDSMGNVGGSYTSSNITLDRKPPVFTNISILPAYQRIGLPVTITANLTELSRITLVRAKITLPNSTVLNYSMTDPDQDKKYNLTFFSTRIPGKYNLTIEVNDSLGNYNQSKKYQFIIDYYLLALSTNSDNYVVQDTVFVSGQGFSSAYNVTVNLYNSSGDSIPTYPKDILSNLTGHINLSWQIPIDQGLGTYYVNATDQANSSRSKVAYFDIVSAIIEADAEYFQGSNVSIIGTNWDPDVDVTVNITGPQGLVFGPTNITSNGTGHLNLTFLLDFNATTGYYVISVYEPSNPNKYDDFTFLARKRAVTLWKQYPWFKAGYTINLSAAGFSTNNDVSLTIRNQSGQLEYTDTLTSNSTGGVYASVPMTFGLGTYTLNVTDLKYTNLGNKTAFDVVDESLSSDKEIYINGDYVIIKGSHWSRGRTYTIDIINQSGRSVFGYPKPIVATSLGNISDSWEAEAVSVGTSYYNITLNSSQDLKEYKKISISVIRVANLYGEVIEVTQDELFNISGRFFSPLSAIEFTLQTNDGDFATFYPKDETSDATGDVNHLFNASNACEVQVTATATDLNFPQLTSNITFNITHLSDNSSRKSAAASSPNGTYNLNGGGVGATQTANNVWQYFGGADFNSEFQAHLNYTFNISALNTIPSRISNLSFVIEYCHSGRQASIGCNFGIGNQHEGETQGPQEIDLYNFSSGRWQNISFLTVNDASDAESSKRFYKGGYMGDFIRNNLLHLRVEVHFNQSGIEDDVLVVDYLNLNVTYRSKSSFACEPYDNKVIRVSNVDGSNQAIPSTSIIILNKTGSLIYSGTNPLYKYIPPREIKLSVLTPLSSSNVTYTILGLNYSQSLNITSAVVEDYAYPKPYQIKNMTALVSVDDAGLEYNKTMLKIPKGNFEINTILHCLQYNYSNGQCLDFELNDTDEFEFAEDSQFIYLNVTGFDSFGGGGGNTLPNLTEVRVYNVTGLADKHKGGELLFSSTNATFNLTPYTLYRVEFIIRNDGRQWSIEGTDYAYQSGLNGTWGVNATRDIWYTDGTNTTNYTGGTWSNGRVEWNLGLGGKIKTAEYGAFSFVVNITTDTSDQYPVYFIVNDTSQRSGSYDNSIYRIFGSLNIELDYPEAYQNISGPGVNFTWTGYNALGADMDCNLTINGVDNATLIMSPSGTPANKSVVFNTEGDYNWSVICSNIDESTGQSATGWFSLVLPPRVVEIMIENDNQSIRLNWTARSNAQSYSIYSAEDLTQDFTLFASGITDLNWTDRNSTQDHWRFYKIAASKGEADALTDVTYAKYHRQLESPWNLVSYPVELDDFTLFDGSSGSKVYTYPGDCVDTIWRWNITNDSFERTDLFGGNWVPGSGSENFESLEPGRGYWYESSDACNITFYGKVQTQNVSLYVDEDDWNMIGWYSPYPRLLYIGNEPLATNISGSIQTMLRYNETNPNKWEIIIYIYGFGWWPLAGQNDFTHIEPSKGYYVDSDFNETLTFDPTRHD